MEYPFDTIKVRLQTQSQSVFLGPVDCLRKTIKQEGITGLYKGLSAPLIGSMYAINHISDDNQHRKRPLIPMLHYAASGFFAGSIVSLVLTPIELVKCKLQVQNLCTVPLSDGPLQIIKRVYTQTGIKGFYSGHMGTFIRESVGGAIWFGVYEYACLQLMRYHGHPIKDNLSPMELAGCGATAGIFFNALVFPADVIKSRQQTSTYGKSAGLIIKELWKSGGFYRGLGITLARSAPVSGTIFLTYETLSRKFGQ